MIKLALGIAIENHRSSIKPLITMVKIPIHSIAILILLLILFNVSPSNAKIDLRLEDLLEVVFNSYEAAKLTELIPSLYFYCENPSEDKAIHHCELLSGILFYVANMAENKDSRIFQSLTSDPSKATAQRSYVNVIDLVLESVRDLVMKGIYREKEHLPIIIKILEEFDGALDRFNWDPSERFAD